MHEAIAVVISVVPVPVAVVAGVVVVVVIVVDRGVKQKLASLVISIPIAQKKPLRLRNCDCNRLRLRPSLTCHQIDNLQWGLELECPSFQ